MFEQNGFWKIRPSMRVVAGFVLGVILAAGMFLMPATPAAATPPAGVSFGVSVSFGPPALPVYSQPYCPGPGYIWTPGYWAWDPNYGYYWVPGTWVPAPYPGALWTPGYWGWEPGYSVFVWHAGYWGPVVGFYGGINYGYGYDGDGYEGGYWRGRNFYYNRRVNNVHVTNITNVYNRTVVINNVSNVSYNGGRGGIMARPTREQDNAFRERRMGPVGNQLRQEQMARSNPNERASVNHGRPMIAATARPGMFRGQGVVRAQRAGAYYRQPPISRGNTRYGSQAPANKTNGGWRQFNQRPNNQGGGNNRNNGPAYQRGGPQGNNQRGPQGAQSNGGQSGWRQFNQRPNNQGGGNTRNNGPTNQRGGSQGYNQRGPQGGQMKGGQRGGQRQMSRPAPQRRNAPRGGGGGNKGGKKNQKRHGGGR